MLTLEISVMSLKEISGYCLNKKLQDCQKVLWFLIMFSVQGNPANLHNNRAGAHCACSGVCGCCLAFFSCQSFLFPFSLSLGDLL